MGLGLLGSGSDSAFRFWGLGRRSRLWEIHGISEGTRSLAGPDIGTDFESLPCGRVPCLVSLCLSLLVCVSVLSPALLRFHLLMYTKIDCRSTDILVGLNYVDEPTNRYGGEAEKNTQASTWI